MRLFRRQAAVGPDKTAHIEIWDHFIDVNRTLKRMVVAMAMTSFVAVLFGSWMGFIAFDRPVVYTVDSEGRAEYAGRRGTADAPADVEARYVAKRFLKHTLAFNSISVQSDLAEAWNLMTPDLQRQQAHELDEYERERGYPFVDFVKRQQIRTTLDFARIQIDNHNNKNWTVRVTGTVRTWPLNRVGEEAGYSQKDVEAQLVLVRVPRTELSPNGLLVAKQTSRFFETQDEAAAMEDTVPGKKP